MPDMTTWICLASLLAASALSAADTVTVAQWDSRISELESKLAKLREPLQSHCVDDIPILRRMLEECGKDIARAQKAREQATVHQMEMKRDEIAKALQQEEARFVPVNVKELTREVALVTQQLAEAKALRESAKRSRKP